MMLRNLQQDTEFRRTDRREFLHQVGVGIHAAALMSLLNDDVYASDQAPNPTRRIHDVTAREPHHSPRATSVIHLFMNGGPSQMDLLDP